MLGRGRFPDAELGLDCRRWGSRKACNWEDWQLTVKVMRQTLVEAGANPVPLRELKRGGGLVLTKDIFNYFEVLPPPGPAFSVWYGPNN